MTIDWLREARWLDGARVRDYLRAIALIQLVTLAWLVGTSTGGVDRNGFLLGTDFLSFWAAARLLWEGGSPYHVAEHIAMQRGIFASPHSFTAFFYPPPFLLVCWPLGALGYLPALAAWLAATGAAYAMALRAWLGRLPWWAFAGFPPVLITVTHGQTAFLVAALLGGGTWLAARERPLMAGLLYGLAVIKPQFGLLLPLVLIAARQWRIIVSAAGTALLLSLAVTLAFGARVWADWWMVTGTAQQAMTAGAMNFGKMTSLFAELRLLGAPVGLAYSAQLGFAAAVALVLVVLAWRRGFTLEIGAATLTGSLLVTPFALDYDLVLLGFPLALLATRPSLTWERTIALLTVLATVIARPLAILTGLGIAPVVLLALFVVLARRAARASFNEKAPENRGLSGEWWA